MIVITSCNDNPDYCEFKDLIHYNWTKNGYNIEIVDARNPPVGVASSVYAKCMRMITASYKPDDTVCMLVDIDDFVVDFDWVNNCFKNYKPDKIVANLGTDIYENGENKNCKTTPKFPLPYCVADAKTFRRIVNPDNLTLDLLLESLMTIDNPIDGKECIKNTFNNFSDESLLRYLIHNNFPESLVPNPPEFMSRNIDGHHGRKGQIVCHYTGKDNNNMPNRQILRPFDITSPGIIDIVLPRPLSVCSGQISHMLDYLGYAWKNVQGPPVLFVLTRRGFFSEVLALCNTIWFCERYNRKLYVKTDIFSYGDIRNYLNIPSSVSFIDDCPRAYKLVVAPWVTNNPEHTEAFHMICNLPKSFDSMRSISQTIFSKLPEPGIELPPIYDCIHVRRGDKVHDKYKQSDWHHINEYISKLPNDDTPIFVMTDDYSVVQETDNKNIFYVVKPNEHGFHDEWFCRTISKTEYKTQDTNRLLQELNIARNSRNFVGTYTSNVGRVIKLLHHDPTKCISLDEEWKWV